jgi:hypothetical protein
MKPNWKVPLTTGVFILDFREDEEANQVSIVLDAQTFDEFSTAMWF